MNDILKIYWQGSRRFDWFPMVMVQIEVVVEWYADDWLNVDFVVFPVIVSCESASREIIPYKGTFRGRAKSQNLE